MHYETLLFDVDNTLLDFDAAEHTAFLLLLRHYGLPESEELCADYSAYNRRLWEQLERKIITREELIRNRFIRFFRTLGVEADGRAEELYRENLTADNRLMPGAEEVCRALQGERQLVLITNGMADTQRKRIAESGLGNYFPYVFISQELGADKPGEEFFRRVFAALPGARPETALIIGDSLSSDIAGGERYGIDTCWVSRKPLPEAPAAVPTYQIASLRELLPLLQSIEERQ